MAKQKVLSPQEQYRARRAREEKEKELSFVLLTTHNSLNRLHKLIATHYLRPVIRSQTLPPVVQPHSITNVHGLIGHHLIALLRVAWDIQDNRRRESVSPKELLSALGTKYDQYLDFCQQDAHEFLCHLLDAIRMEDNDLIKHHQSPPQSRSTERTQSSRLNHPADDDHLVSFVDVLFGGKLASILVCQACKHVSHTYEDFTDLSLSMKPEDYARERKRDKLKQFAKKIGTAFYVATPQPRSSSVPATPIRTSNLDTPEHTDPQRRRSIDLADVEVVVEPINHRDPKEDPARSVAPSSSPAPDTPSAPGTPTDAPHPVPVPDLHVPVSPGDHPAPEKVNGKERKDKDESWAKISKRIGASVSLAMRPKSERKDKKPSPVEANATAALVTVDTVGSGVPPHPHPEREPASLGTVNEKLQAQLTNVKRSVMPAQRSGNSPLGTSTPRFPLISRPSSPGTYSRSSKPPRPPKLSTEEAAYLRDILADINPPNVPKPFSIFKQSKDPSSSTSSPAQSIFLKLNQINRIEECLRLFTSVEVLDGDNTVRCHRCWKIANGFYKYRARGSAQDPDSCTDSEDEGVAAEEDHRTPAVPVPVPVSSSASALHSTASLQDTQLITRDTQSTLTQHSSCASSTHKRVPPALQINDGYPIELVSPVRDDTPTQSAPTVPSISTAPESPVPVQTARPAPPVRGNTLSSTVTRASPTTDVSSPSRMSISLSAPSDPHRQHHGSRSADSNTESESENETLISVYSDVSSVVSTTSPNASQEHLQQPLPVANASIKDKRIDTTKDRGVPRSRQFVLRPAYKRYLIATPPPILIVHLKRFQQLSRTPVVSFSTGFKKLDDYISFPEYLDLGPYLAPRREDYFDSKVAVTTRGRSARRPAPCMYRLYAVVVHIGNMLGGHYVAYTALPPSEAINLDTARPEGERARTTPRDWAFISDTHVRLASLEEVLKSKAYVCMYERI